MIILPRTYATVPFFTQNLAYSAAEIKKRLTCNHDKLVKHIYVLALCPLTSAI